MDKLTRPQLIERLRDKLISMTDDDHSICEVAAAFGVYCQGFANLTSTELREKFGWLEEKAHKPLTRPQLEERANKWELARQVYHDVELACDAAQIDRDKCTGWDGFSDADLERFCREICGESVEIVGSPGEPND